ncbi:MAG TPA: hypothetical protein PLZ36_04075 [Armatimonadota bacterium]|nr:hypothetical protein [Armatimonadota bacterium]HOS42554.1 hypothetical protein [Armatimonadota bacterium]
MTISALPEQRGSEEARAPAQRGLTPRSFVITLFALLVLAIWVEYQERYLFGGPLVENAPPNGVVSILLALLALGALLARFRRSLRLTVAELVVIYAALLVAAPLMTQGLWTRLFALITTVPHYQDFTSYESLPSVLWPHGDNLVPGRFNGQLNGFIPSDAAAVGWETLHWRGRPWRCPVISAPDGSVAALSYTLPRAARGREPLISGEPFLFSCLVRTDAFVSDSSFFATLSVDGGPPRTILTSTMKTAPSLSLPAGLTRVGISPVAIPAHLRDRLTLTIGLRGGGRLTLQDVQLLNVVAVEGAYTGTHLVREGRWRTLGAHERDFTARKPDALWSVAGLRYLFTGFIPVAQWVTPLLAWSALIAALFLGFMGLNVLMRKQWVHYERLTFPLNTLPRALLTETATAVTSIWRSPFCWAGFAVALLLAVWKGLHFYFPTVPSLPIGDVWAPVSLHTYVAHPLWKAFLQQVAITLPLTLLAIALLVETDVLFSVWACYLLFQLWHVAGKVGNFSRYPGYPWAPQQHIGSFLGYGLLALFVARKHLWHLLRHLAGREAMDARDELVSYRAAAGFVLLSLMLLIGWGIWTGMGWLASLLFFGWMLTCGFAASKIRAEAGMPFGYWMPYYGMFFVSAMGGFAVFGTTGMLVASLAAGFMCVAVFLFIAPAQVEMLELGRQLNVRLHDIGAGLWIGLLGGIFIGGFAFLCWTYGKGADNFAFSWPYQQNWYLNSYRQGEAAADRAFVAGTLGQDPQTRPLDIVSNPDAKGIAVGLGITGALATLRHLFVWFPLHPLGYVLAASSFSFYVWFTCFVAWAIRAVVQRLGGAHTMRKALLPFAIGMFLACVASVVLFELIGLVLGATGPNQVYNKMP